MKAFHKQLQDRLEATGDFSQPMWHFMADVLEHAATEADKWTNRVDDARRIPDVIDEAVRWCREEAKKHEVADPVVVRLEAELRVLQVGLAELGNRLLTVSCDPPRGYRLANQDGLWWLFDHRGEGVEWGDTLEELARKLGGGE